jgi:hypothetical protein
MRRRCVVAALWSCALLTVVSFAQPRGVDPSLLKLVNFARAELDRYWRGRVRGFTAPVDLVMFQAPASTDCGRYDQPNAFYCSSTHKVYWDVSLFTSQYALGDYAPVFILAHEWAHVVQRALGLFSSEAGLMTVQIELQADCLAGTFTADLAKRGLLDPGDDEEAIRSLLRVGDRLQTPWFDSDAHGTPGFRIDAFIYGLEGRDCTAGTFLTFLQERGIDPSRAPQRPTAQSGSIAGMIARQVGRFALRSTKRVELANSLDAIEATYRTPDGIEVSHLLTAYPKPDQANRMLDAVVTDVKQQGYVEMKRQPVTHQDGRRLGTLVLLQGKTEVVIWTNLQLVGAAEGPRNMAWEFYGAVPY